MGCRDRTRAWAQSTRSHRIYPTKPIRIIVPFPPVGAADLLTRTIGQKLTEAWGQQIIVDNRPGVGGNLGVELAAKAPPDGYTAVMAAVTTNAIGMSTYTKLGYHLERDLAPVALAGNVPHVLVAHPTLPAKNVKELIALGKARPGELIFASQGQGTLSHLEQEMLQADGRLHRAARPVQGQRTGARRSHSGQRAAVLRQHSLVASAREDRPDPRARRRLEQALARDARRARHRRIAQGVRSRQLVRAA